jgi:hypothetical protein
MVERRERSLPLVFAQLYNTKRTMPKLGTNLTVRSEHRQVKFFEAELQSYFAHFAPDFLVQWRLCLWDLV